MHASEKFHNRQLKYLHQLKLIHTIRYVHQRRKRDRMRLKILSCPVNGRTGDIILSYIFYTVIPKIIDTVIIVNLHSMVYKRKNRHKDVRSLRLCLVYFEIYTFPIRSSRKDILKFT